MQWVCEAGNVNGILFSSNLKRNINRRHYKNIRQVYFLRHLWRHITYYSTHLYGFQINTKSVKKIVNIECNLRFDSVSFWFSARAILLHCALSVVPYQCHTSVIHAFIQLKCLCWSNCNTLSLSHKFYGCHLCFLLFTWQLEKTLPLFLFWLVQYR